LDSSHFFTSLKEIGKSLFQRNEAAMTIAITISWKSILFSVVVFNTFNLSSGLVRDGRNLQPQGKGMYTKRPYLEGPLQENVDSIPYMIYHPDQHPTNEKLGEYPMYLSFVASSIDILQQLRYLLCFFYC